MQSVADTGTAIWIENTADIPKIESAIKAAEGKNMLVMFVLYNLPNKNCASYHTTREFTCTHLFLPEKSCSHGLGDYRTKFIDPILAILRKYPDVPTVFILEPNSLTTWQSSTFYHIGDESTCINSEQGYKDGLAYTINHLSYLPNVTTYLDNANGALFSQQDMWWKFTNVLG